MFIPTFLHSFHYTFSGLQWESQPRRHHYRPVQQLQLCCSQSDWSISAQSFPWLLNKLATSLNSTTRGKVSSLTWMEHPMDHGLRLEVTDFYSRFIFGGWLQMVAREQHNWQVTGMLPLAASTRQVSNLEKQTGMDTRYTLEHIPTPTLKDFN